MCVTLVNPPPPTHTHSATLATSLVFTEHSSKRTEYQYAQSTWTVRVCGGWTVRVCSGWMVRVCSGWMVRVCSGWMVWRGWCVDVCAAAISMCLSQVDHWTDMVLCRRKCSGELQLL